MPRNAASIADRFRDAKQDYRAAKPSRFRAKRTGVPHLGAGADFHYRNEHEYLRIVEEVRDMERNDVVTSPLLDRVVDNTIQCGFTPDPDTGDKKLDEDLLAGWNDWAGDADACDVTGEHTWHALEALVFRAVLRDGDNLPLPLATGQLEVVETHRLRSPSSSRARDKRNIVLGVQMDRRRRRTAYWFTKDELDPLRQSQIRLSDLRPIPARDADGNRNVLHVYNPRRVNQTRGMTAFAPIFDTIGMHDDVQFAKLIHQQVVSCFAMIETAEQWSTPQAGKFGAEHTESGPGPDSVARTLSNIAPGMHIPVPSGHQLNLESPNIPNPEFFPHVRLILQLIGINLGLPLVLFLMDASETNFSGWRGAFDQAKLGFVRNQQALSERFHRPVWAWRARHLAERDPAMLAQLEKLGPAFFKHTWNFPSWPYIEPLKDAQADLLQTRNALNSPRRVQAARGRDWQKVADEIVSDNGYAIERAAEEAKRLNAILPNDQKVHWRELISLPTPDGVSMTLQPDQPQQPQSGTENAPAKNRPAA